MQPGSPLVLGGKSPGQATLPLALAAALRAEAAAGQLGPARSTQDDGDRAVAEQVNEPAKHRGRK